ncbi:MULTISPECIES: hypothetical protein [Streptomyces]|uniref:Uncharacterized protein n=1 Tax=Streptomyces flaveolus TaxID=67297 RepID=A0ABV3AAF1_9ACTN|nr:MULTISPECIES: hypothetical protein [Streptomyces]
MRRAYAILLALCCALAAALATAGPAASGATGRRQGGMNPRGAPSETGAPRFP